MVPTATTRCVLAAPVKRVCVVATGLALRENVTVMRITMARPAAITSARIAESTSTARAGASPSIGASRARARCAPVPSTCGRLTTTLAGPSCATTLAPALLQAAVSTATRATLALGAAWEGALGAARVLPRAAAVCQATRVRRVSYGRARTSALAMASALARKRRAATPLGACATPASLGIPATSTTVR